MSNATHTPGEWQTIQPRREGKHWRVATLLPDDPERRLFFVAMIDNGAPGDTLRTEAANARLIAAAPDLLAACLTALMAIDVYSGQSSILDESADHLKAAIAKARG